MWLRRSLVFFVDISNVPELGWIIFVGWPGSRLCIAFGYDHVHAGLRVQVMEVPWSLELQISQTRYCLWTLSGAVGFGSSPSTETCTYITKAALKRLLATWRRVLGFGVTPLSMKILRTFFTK